MSPRGGALVAALLSFASACGNSAREDASACQRRLVAESGGAAARPRRPGESAMVSVFAGMRRGFERMPLDGCSEDQRVQARIMARVAADLASAAAKIGDPRLLGEQDFSLRTNQPFVEFQSRIEEFERRRQALREDLDRMTVANH